MKKMFVMTLLVIAVIVSMSFIGPVEYSGHGVPNAAANGVILPMQGSSHSPSVVVPANATGDSSGNLYKNVSTPCGLNYTIEFLHAVFIQNGVMKITNNTGALANFSCPAGVEHNYTVLGSTATTLTNYTGYNDRLMIVGINTTFQQPNGTITNAELYAVLFVAEVKGYTIYSTDILSGEAVLGDIEVQKSNSNNTLLLGDEVVAFGNTTFTGYLAETENTIHRLVNIYLGSENSTLQAVGQQYLVIANSLNIEIYLVKWLNPSIGDHKVAVSMTIVVDSTSSCIACQGLIILACAVGCAAACFLTFGGACLACAVYIDYISLGCSAAATIACTVIGWCP